MFSFGRKKHALLGIDISSTAIKLVELTRTGSYSAGQYRVQAFAHEPLPAGAVVDKKFTDLEAIGNTILKAVRRSGSKAKHAAVAVSAPAVITRNITVPAGLSDAEIEAQIQLDADQHIPYPLEEVNMDFAIVGPSATANDLVEVLLAASRRENVDDRVAVLEAAGLTPEIVDIETHAMEGACALQLRQIDDSLAAKTVAAADVGATATSLHVLHDQKIVYTREQNFGGNQLLNEIQRRYDMSPEDALLGLAQLNNSSEQNAPSLQKTIKLPENAHTEIIGPFQEALAQQISRALQFFYSASSYGRIDKLILCGGAASIAGIDGLITQRLGFPVSVANPFTEMVVGTHIDETRLKRVAPSMMLAVGLALRGVD